MLFAHVYAFKYPVNMFTDALSHALAVSGTKPKSLEAIMAVQRPMTFDVQLLGSVPVMEREGNEVVVDGIKRLRLQMKKTHSKASEATLVFAKHNIVAIDRFSQHRVMHHLPQVYFVFFFFR